MRVLVVFFILGVIYACKKDKCYDCEQTQILSVNKRINGYPQYSRSKFVSCGDHIDVVDDGKPFITYYVEGDTIYTLRVDSKCVPQSSWF